MQTAKPPAASQADTTFRAFNKEQGRNYAQHRRSYHNRLYDAIMDCHAPLGQFDTILDVGCGPGMAVRDLAPLFNHAIGIDPSEGMINTAKSLGGVSAGDEPIRFDIASAEDLGAGLSPPIADGSVDLLTVATAAHWFDMSLFWPQAARVLKPGGTVAIWTSASMRVDVSTPNHAAIQAAIDRLEQRVDDYVADGNRLNSNLYVDLPLPWTLASPEADFDRGSFVRKEWATGEGSEPGDQFYAKQSPAGLDVLEKILSTTSPVTRWRQANPTLVGTESDPVKMLRNEIEQAFYDVGVDKKEDQLIHGGVAAVLLVVKKKMS
ncbi:S-adenosyl-L-methionine-dependent methyltransferase [Thozetella sp. PMI_491]|nr:S-adenosyl-L-methionine-dependent methyltransferase [Thozetella sp. PMI_491]